LSTDFVFREKGDVNNRGMARGGHGLPKVSLGPAMPDPSMPSGILGVATRRVGSMHPFSTPLDTLQPFQGKPPAKQTPAAVFYPFGHPTPYASDVNLSLASVWRPSNLPEAAALSERERAC
jgi:hypothetical protein